MVFDRIKQRVYFSFARYSDLNVRVLITSRRRKLFATCAVDTNVAPSTYTSRINTGCVILRVTHDTRVIRPLIITSRTRKRTITRRMDRPRRTFGASFKHMKTHHERCNG